MPYPFTLDDLKRILRDSAGDNDKLDRDILDDTFDDLGYESLALLEVCSRVEREYAVSLDEDRFADATTPRELVDFVNAQLPTVAEA